MNDVETRRRHAAWLRECARRAEALAAEYRANADRIDPEADISRHGDGDPGTDTKGPRG